MASNKLKLMQIKMESLAMKKIIIISFLGLLVSACAKPVEPLTPPRPALVIIVGKSAANNAMILVGEVKSL